MAAEDKNNPFRIPEGYFETFRDKLMDKIDSEKEGLPKEEGFTVPEDYFVGLPKVVQQKLDGEHTNLVQLRPYRKYYLAAASMAAILMLVFGLNWNSADTHTFEELATTDIDTYFEENDYGLSSYEIGELLAAEDLEMSDMLENEIEDENVLEYLNENINDFEELNLDEYE